MEYIRNDEHHEIQFTITQLMEFWMISNSDISILLDRMHLSKEIIKEILDRVHEENLLQAISEVLEEYKWITNFYQIVLEYANEKMYGDDVLKHQRIAHKKNIVLSQVEALLM